MDVSNVIIPVKNTQCDRCFLSEATRNGSFSSVVLGFVRREHVGIKFPLILWIYLSGGNQQRHLPPHHQDWPCRDWSYYVSSFTIKDIMTRKENKLAKTGFYKLLHLKPIIQFHFLVIDWIFVLLFLPQLLDPFHSSYAEFCDGLFLLCFGVAVNCSSAATRLTPFIVVTLQTAQSRHEQTAFV